MIREQIKLWEDEVKSSHFESNASEALYWAGKMGAMVDICNTSEGDKFLDNFQLLLVCKNKFNVIIQK